MVAHHRGPSRGLITAAACNRGSASVLVHATTHSRTALEALVRQGVDALRTLATTLLHVVAGSIPCAAPRLLLQRATAQRQTKHTNGSATGQGARTRLETGSSKKGSSCWRAASSGSPGFFPTFWHAAQHTRSRCSRPKTCESASPPPQKPAIPRRFRLAGHIAALPHRTAPRFSSPIPSSYAIALNILSSTIDSSLPNSGHSLPPAQHHTSSCLFYIPPHTRPPFDTNRSSLRSIACSLVSCQSLVDISNPISRPQFAFL